MEYKFAEIEEKWKKRWAETDVYKVTEDSDKPKYYVLDMFPYPSGAGLHVGHPLGYVASDIYARYKRLKGYNVLHPMGYDAFGLPAEQYAIETGTHPATTTEKAIQRYREQMDKIGFSYDWKRSVKTSDPSYYKWTQWIFLKLFNSWYNRKNNKAEPIATLINHFETNGSVGISSSPSVHRTPTDRVAGERWLFSSSEWKNFSEAEKQKILMHYRLAYLSYAEVNWCPALGTVLANDEVKDGKSERGGHPVERRKMRQWFLRITEYSDRLLEGLERLDWSEAMKDMQRNWIGRSEGASIKFHLSQTLSEGEGLKKPRYYTADGQTWNHNIELAKKSRGKPTEAENIIWERLRAKKTGHKFRRQHPVDQFIVDFVCLEKGLIVEIDGKIHEQQNKEDKERTETLNRYGFEVIRFSNEQVIADVDNVIEEIIQTLNNKLERTPLKKIRPEGAGKKVLSFGEDLGEVVVFTTRPDTIFGATFMVIAPEHELIEHLVTPEQKTEVENYLAHVKSRTDVERQQEKKVTGVFTGAYALNPFTNEDIPIWIAEYVLAGYGTGAIMAVPADDERDRKFAEKFGLPIVDIIDKSMYPGTGIEDKVGKMINSGFLNGMEVKDAIKAILDEIEDMEIGTRKVNYKQHDAGFSRQRYWGEPFPIKYKIVGKPDAHLEGEGESDDIPYALDEKELPLILPEVSTYKPTGDGRSPLANSEEWVAQGYETDTMPGYAGSSWYFLRYMDADNDQEFASKQKMDYWKNVDIYFGGAEHAVGHLLYSRMWCKFLCDLGLVPFDEPFQKLVNQGMIQGVSKFVYRLNFNLRVRNDSSKRKGFRNDQEEIRYTMQVSQSMPVIFVSKEIYDKASNSIILPDQLGEKAANYSELIQRIFSLNEVEFNPKGFDFTALHVDIKYVDGDILNITDFKQWDKYKLSVGDAVFVRENDGYVCGSAIEKMSKSKYNVISPDDVIAKHGADCFRMYEMFLGPIEQSKPWDDKGISGVQNFLRKFWRMFYDTNGNWKVKDEAPSDAEFKILHKTLKKVADDIERLNFNTCVSWFMIATNELSSLNSSKKQILEPLLIALAPLAPFITEELWEQLGNKTSIHLSSYPKIEEQYLVESTHEYPVSVNGKTRAQISLPLDMPQDEVQKLVMQLENVKKWTNGSEPKKFIFVKGKIINVVI